MKACFSRTIARKTIDDTRYELRENSDALGDPVLFYVMYELWEGAWTSTGDQYTEYNEAIKAFESM